MSNQTAEIESMRTIPGAAGEFEDESENENAKGASEMAKCEVCGSRLLSAGDGYEYQCVSCLYTTIERLESELENAKGAEMKCAYKTFSDGDFLEGARAFIDTVASRLIAVNMHGAFGDSAIVVWYWEGEAADTNSELKKWIGSAHD